MPKKTVFAMITMLALGALVIGAEELKNSAVQKEITGREVTVIYPIGYTPRFSAEVACTVRMAGDAYWALSDWLIGNEIYKTYQDPTVEGLDCTFPVEIDAVAMQFQFSAAGTVWCSVDIEALHPDLSLPSCPYPGGIIDVSPESGFYIPSAGTYLSIIPFDSPVVVEEPFFCGFYIANDVSGMDPALILDNDPYLCVNWNDWGEGYADLVSNDYYDFPGNLVLYSIGRSGFEVATPPIAKFTWPLDSTQISGNIRLRATELVDSVIYSYCRFEYYFPGLGWNVIGDDSDPTVSLRNGMTSSSYLDGYAKTWNASNMAEGWYKLRAFITDSLGNSSADTISVYLDNTPLKPEITNPSWCVEICDSVTMTATAPDEDISLIQFDYMTTVDTISINPTFLLQSRYGDTDDDTTDGNHYSSGEYGEFYNAPTLVGSIVRHFADNGYSALAIEGSTDLTDRAIVEELADSMRIRQNLGAEDDDFLWAVSEYFHRKGNNFTIEHITSLTGQNLDYIAGYRDGVVICAIGEPYGHWLEIIEMQFPQNEDNSYNIKIYDTKTGSAITTAMLFDPIPQIYYSGEYRTVDMSLSIYPKVNPNSKTAIGLDFNPADGWSFYWDISALDDGKYYISGTGLDASSHSGEGVTRTYIACLPDYVAGDTNGDGAVNISDAVRLINYVFTGGPPPLPFLMNGDTNCDGSVNISDAVRLINYVFSGGPGPCN